MQAIEYIKKLLISLLLMIFAFIIIIIFSPMVFVINIFMRHKHLPEYFYSIAIGLDQLGGSILYCQPDWTVSSWTYYLAEFQNKLPAKILMKIINFIFGKNHCEKSYFHEMDINSNTADEDYHHYMGV